MVEDELKEEIEKLLNVPVLNEHEALRPPCVTISCYEESTLIFGDGKAERHQEAFQIEIWTDSKSEMTEMKEKLRKLLEDNYAAPVIASGYEQETDKYRAILTLTLLERSRKNGDNEE